jgi:Domain of unknown function (DUF4185)
MKSNPLGCERREIVSAPDDPSGAVLAPKAPHVKLLLAVLSGAWVIAGIASWGQQGTVPSSQTWLNHPHFKKSKVLIGFQWLGDEVEYPPPGPGEDKSAIGPVNPYLAKAGYHIHGDTFPMTWADDDEIYASAGDPGWGGKNDGLDVEKISGTPPQYKITRVNAMADYKGSGGSGPKPSGMISVNGVLYLAFQNVLGTKPPAHGPRGPGQQGSQHGSDATIVSSRDHGKTWTPDIKEIKAPMFPGDIFGGPAFVNTGRDNADAPDQYVYAVSTDQWDNGSTLRVGRVPPDRVQDRSAWEWIAGLKDYDHPLWSGNLQQAISVLNDDRRISEPDMVYVASIKRYLLLTWRLHKDFSPVDGTELMIYDAPHAWGPFTLVHREAIWESVDMNPYCPRLPLKWLKANDHELVGWIQFSGSWRQNSPHYCSHVREFKMQIRTL